jgi:gluconate 2-dehydrogenase gamma chain
MSNSSFSPSGLSRRHLLATTALLLLSRAAGIKAETIQGALPWKPDAGEPPEQVRPGPWQYFTPEEGAAVEALVDRIIPPDPETPGGKDAGCAIFIDRQLAGPYGGSRGLYMRPPFMHGTPQQGAQSPLTPATLYRQALAALDEHCKQAFVGKTFAQLPDADKDRLLTSLQKGELQLPGTTGSGFFDLLLQNTKEGFFADPIYGGNRDMAGWKMIGFPGARYDYRDWVERHNERYPLPPVGIGGRADWTPRHT